MIFLSVDVDGVIDDRFVNEKANSSTMCYAVSASDVVFWKVVVVCDVN